MAINEITNEQIIAFVQANIGSPQTIADAMAANGISADRVSQATGYSVTQVNDYLAAAPAPTYTPPAPYTPPAASAPAETPKSGNPLARVEDDIDQRANNQIVATPAEVSWAVRNGFNPADIPAFAPNSGNYTFNNSNAKNLDVSGVVKPTWDGGWSGVTTTGGQEGGGESGNANYRPGTFNVKGVPEGFTANFATTPFEGSGENMSGGGLDFSKITGYSSASKDIGDRTNATDNYDAQGKYINTTTYRPGSAWMENRDTVKLIAVAAAAAFGVPYLTEAGVTAAETIIAGGGTASEAAAAATLATEGTAVTASTFQNLTSAFEGILSNANNLTSFIGEALLPAGVDPALAKFVGQTAINTITNGGNIGKAITNSLISVGAGYVGSTVAAETGSKILGNVASSAANTLAHGNKLNVANLAGTAAGTLLGNEVKDLTGSSFAGDVAKIVGKDLVSGKADNIGSNLLNLGINQVTNYATGQITDFVKSAGGDSATVGGDSVADSATKGEAASNLLGSADTAKQSDASSIDSAVAKNFGSAVDAQDNMADIIAAYAPSNTSTNTVGGEAISGAADTSAIETTGGLNAVSNVAADTVPTKVDVSTLIPINGTTAGTPAAVMDTVALVGGLNAVSNATTNTPDTVATPVGGLTAAANTAIDTAAGAVDTGTADINLAPTNGLNTLNSATPTGTASATTTPVNTTSPLGGLATAATSGLKTVGKNLLRSSVKNAVSNVAGVKTKPPKLSASGLGRSVATNMAKSVPKIADISKLIPIAQGVRKAPAKVAINTLSPVKNIAGLTSLLKGKG